MYVRLDFGKHRGQLIEDVPSSYLHWAVLKADCIRPWLRARIEEELQRRGQGSGQQRPETPRPPTGGQMVDVRTVIQSWWREMSMLHHPDRGGRHEVMAALNNAHDRLRQLAGVA